MTTAIVRTVNTMASGPWLRSGNLKYRVVLRAKSNDGRVVEFVVHTETLEAGRTGYTSGHYFRVDGKGASDIMAAYEAAFRKWQERTAEKSLNVTFDELFGE